MRDDDRVRIRHMIDAADALAQFIEGRSVEDLDRDRLLLFAVVRAIEIVGEAASKISTETQGQMPDVRGRRLWACATA